MRPPVSQAESRGAGVGQCRVVDGLEYWDHVDERHAEHRRHATTLLVMFVIVTLLGATGQRGFLMVALVIALPLALETWAARRTRPR